MFLRFLIFMKTVNEKDFVNKNDLKTYDEIDGLKVIEELLLFKGVEIAGAVKVVHKKHLDDMALVVYNLKVNATNRLYVGMQLDKFYHRAGLVCDSGRVKVPTDIYNRVKELNDSYKTPPKQAAFEIEVEGMSEAWPLRDVLSKLADAAKILLDKKNYDGPDYEEIEHCVKRANDVISQLSAPQPKASLEGIEDYLSIIFALCRCAIANSRTDATVHQITRLIKSLRANGRDKDADNISEMLSTPSDDNFKIVQSEAQQPKADAGRWVDDEKGYRPDLELIRVCVYSLVAHCEKWDKETLIKEIKKTLNTVDFEIQKAKQTSLP